MAFREFEGRTWDPAIYVAVDDDGELQAVAQARGNENFYHPKRSSNVVFGHRTFEAATEDRFIIAEAGRGAIAVLDWSGREIAEIPLQAGVRLSAAQRRAGHQVLESQGKRFHEQMMRAPLPFDVGDFDANPPWLKDWPINEVAPPIDTVLTDYDKRLWVREYRLPDQDSVTWRVWDLDRVRPLFTARMDGNDVLLDARGDLVLLRWLDAFDVPPGRGQPARGHRHPQKRRLTRRNTR